MPERVVTLQKKKLLIDVFWSISALVLMNGVMQLFVYPQLNHRLGAERFGDVLYVMGVIAVFAPSVGSAVNNTRLVRRREYTVENGDALLSIGIMLIPSLAVFLWMTHGFFSTAGQWVAAVGLLLATALRYYGDAEFRMSLFYKGYFLYYCAISIGYIAGVGLYRLTDNWMLAFLPGELLCFLYVLWRGHIYRPLRRSENQWSFFRHAATLAVSYLFYNAVLNMDRVLLQGLMGGKSVTVFYVASLLGKTLALLVVPLNGIIIGYLTKGTQKITRKAYLFTSVAVVVVGAVLYGAICVVMPWFARTFYRDVAEEILALAPLANLSQIACFSSSLLLTVMLTFCSERWQLLTQGSYVVVFLLLATLGANHSGIQGFVMGVLIANLLRLAFVCALGTAIAGRGADRQLNEKE